MNPSTIRRFVMSFPILFVLLTFGACNAALEEQAIQAKITDATDKVYDEIVSIRRDIHQHPELSGSESRTAALVAEHLKSCGLEVRTNVGGNGVVGILRGNTEGPIVAYRADMDALPQRIREDVPFQSATPGIAHACGHDVHTAVGLGVASVLSSLRDDLSGTVVFYFQPSEENVEGAQKMIGDGAMNDPAPEAIFAIHVAPTEIGRMVTNPGVGLPGLVRFTIRLTGSGDLQKAAAALADSIRRIGTVSYPESPDQWESAFDLPFEKDGPYSSFLLAMAWTNKATSARERSVSGFFKASGEEEYEQARAETRTMVAALETRGIKGEIESNKILPDMFCDKELAMWAIDPLESILGEESVLTAQTSIPFFGEDFAFFLERIPGVMFFLGASNTEQGILALPHSPTFGVDEEAIRVGVKGISNVIARYLMNPPERANGD